MGPDPAPQDAQAFIASLDEVDLARYRVVGTYTRYDESVRNALQDARQKILAGFEPPGRKRENHLIWAAPGTGKTYFVQQVAASLRDGVRYHEVNLAKCSAAEFQAALGRLEDGQPSLCLIDEADAKPQEPWPYEVLLPYLDASVERGARFVFVLAGSSGSRLEDIKQRIAARPKGNDLLSRIPTGHEHVIAPMSLGDRLLIVLSQLRQAGQEQGRDIRAIEKLGLYYVALNHRLGNARQLREFAVRAVERVPKTDHRVKYDHLFVPGDPENKTFWAQASPVAERLVNSFIIVAGERAEVAPKPVASTPSPNNATAAFSAATAAARPRTNLPRELTSFVGREREIEEVKRLLSTTALLTLHGPGGCGKTRLAFRVAADLVDKYPDGVWVAELAALSDPGLVSKAIATALEVPEQPGRSLTETLKQYLEGKSPLLVLDNCEHLVDACAELADGLLKTCPHLRILATSREPLGIAGETVWDVPALSVPLSAHVPDLDGLAGFDAIRLFVDRAATHKPGFALTAGSAAAITQVCNQLDGIPLAIELAAARVRVLSVDQIAARLDDRFRLLTGGGRTVLPRHRTLRAAMDWSYALLPDQEQTLLCRLSVFAGGWTVEAAEQVCGDSILDAPAILDVLTSLVDKSLVLVVTETGDARYRLLETVRQYAAEKLGGAGDVNALKRRHCGSYLGVAEQAGPRWGGLAMPIRLDLLEREHDNFRAALEWSGSDSGDPELGLRLAVALTWFWEMRGHFNEGRRWLEGLIARCEAAPPRLRAAALNAAGVLAYRQGDNPRVLKYCSEALRLCDRCGDGRGAGRALHFLAHLQQAEGNYVAATEMMERSVALHRTSGDAADLANSVDCLGEIARSAGDDVGAKVRSAEALNLYRALGHVRGQAHTMHNLAYVQMHQGDLAGARRLFRESLLLVRDLGALRDQAFAVAGLACASVDNSDAQRVACLLAAAAAALSTLEVRLEPAEDTEFRRAVAAMNGRLDPPSYANAWAEGQAMTLEQAVEYALATESEDIKPPIHGGM